MAEYGKIKYVQNLLKTKKISCRELVQKYLENIVEFDKNINSYIEITQKVAMETADKVDKKIASNTKLLPLEGVPMALKDNISTKDIKTTCCSKVLQNYIPPFDATVSKILKSQNAVLLGKNNMDEFAMGCACNTSCFGKTSNPHNANYVPGGSSGGGTAAVAANFAVYALGSDTGGSIRQPSSFCGTVGLKPTYGAISRYGLISLASSLDQIGPITHSVEDAAIVFDNIAQKDMKDFTCMGNPNGPTQISLKNCIKGTKIGLPIQYFDGINKEVDAALAEVIATYKALGADFVELDMPDIKYSLPIYYILACSEIASNFARFDGIRYGHKTASYSDISEFYAKTREESFGEDVKRRILLGNYVLFDKNREKYYNKALKIRKEILCTFNNAFNKCDVILSPTVAQLAFVHDFKPENPMEAYMSDLCTVPVNIAGLCAVSVPCGRDSNGLPIGMQLIGNHFCEHKILNAAYKFEEATSGKHLNQLKMGVVL